MVKWTAYATTQLRHIHNHIAQDSPLYAKRVSEGLIEVLAVIHKWQNLQQEDIPRDS